MRKSNTRLAATLTALAVVCGALADQQVLKNGSAEIALPDPRLANGWTFFGGTTVERSTEQNFTSGGSASLKIFGGATTVGAFQDVPVTPGANVTISARLYTRSNDYIGGDASANIKLEFLDGADQPVGTPTEIPVLTPGSTADVWTLGTIGPQAAPTGAAKARMTCVWVYTNSSSGAAYWDNCSLTINAGANQLINGEFETAGGATLTPTNYNGFGTQEISTAVPAFHGQNTVKVSVGATQGGFCGFYQDPADVFAGERILMRGWIYNPSINGLSQQAAAAIKLEFFPPGGGSLPPPEENLAFDQSAALDTWTLVTLTTTVPSAATAAKIVMIANDTSTTNGPVFVDSAFAERSSAPGVNQLLNSSFELGPGGVNGLTNWTEFRSVNCSARKAFVNFANNGSNVLQIQGSCVAGVGQDITVAAGETLTIRAVFYSRSTQPFNDPVSTAGVKVEWSAGNVPPQIDIGAQGQNNTLLAGAAVDQWSPVTIDYVMPPGSAARMRCTAILGLYNATSADVYFDGLETVIVGRFNGADVDADSDEDLLDVAELQRTFRGSGVTPPGWLGIVFDNDRDQDVDVTDWNFFRPRITGPN